MDLLTSGQVTRLLGISYRQLDYLTTQNDIPLDTLGEQRGAARLWIPDFVRRLQVAVALGNVLGSGDDGMPTPLPEAARRVLAGPIPEPTRLVCLTDDGVHYVNYIADLELQIVTFAVVAMMPGLWPDVSPEVYNRTMSRADPPFTRKANA